MRRGDFVPFSTKSGADMTLTNRETSTVAHDECHLSRPNPIFFFFSACRQRLSVQVGRYFKTCDGTMVSSERGR